MKRHIEDVLVQAAFEDLAPEEIAEAEKLAAANPQAATALGTYRRMREELRGLKVVPADQLSSERLRHAILAQGLKPKPARPEWTWLWAPAAAAFIGFAMIAYQRGSNQSSLALVGLTAPPSETVALNPGSAGDAFHVKPLENPSSLVWKENSEAAPSHTAVRETPRHSQRRRLVARNEAPASRGGAAISMRQTPVHSTDEPSPYSGMADLIEAAASMQPTPNDPPIVLVAGEADAMTGAHRAIEVETASNVLVGG